MFSSEFFEILESTGFTEHLLATSSIMCGECGCRLIIVVETKILNTFRSNFHEPLSKPILKVFHKIKWKLTCKPMPNISVLVFPVKLYFTWKFKLSFIFYTITTNY